MGNTQRCEKYLLRSSPFNFPCYFELVEEIKQTTKLSSCTNPVLQPGLVLSSLRDSISFQCPIKPIICIPWLQATALAESGASREAFGGEYELSRAGNKAQKDP